MHEYLERRRQATQQAVDALPADHILTGDEEALVSQLSEQLRIAPIVLREDAAQVDPPQEVNFQRQDIFGEVGTARGTRVRIHVPFEGEPDLFGVRPTQFTLNPPRADIGGGELLIVWEGDAAAAGQVKALLDNTLASVRQHLEWSKGDIDGFNQRLPKEISDRLERRRQHLEHNQAIVDALNIPIRQRPDASSAFVPLPRRRQVSIAPMQTTRERRLSDVDYEALIDQLTSARGLIERLPATFAPMGEEALRDIVLVILNNEFGIGAAEAFSRSGKTDITIHHDKGAVFIAECKIWSGDKAFSVAIDQLLNYLVWRDTKAALIVFVHEKDITGISEKAATELRSHPRFVRDGGATAGGPTFMLHHDGDAQRHVRVALVVVPIPAD